MTKSQTIIKGPIDHLYLAWIKKKENEKTENGEDPKALYEINVKKSISVAKSKAKKWQISVL